MADTSIPGAALMSAEEILAPSPGALLRRRIFHHWGLVIGGTILTVSGCGAGSGASRSNATGG